MQFGGTLAVQAAAKPDDQRGPPAFRHPDNCRAVAYVDDWVRFMGGSRTSGIITESLPGGGLIIDQFDVDIAADYVLSVSMVVTGDLSPVEYSFNFRRGAELLWRHDMHKGHEHAHGGPTYKHIGPAQNVREAHPPVTLVEVAEPTQQADQVPTRPGHRLEHQRTDCGKA